MCHFLLTVIRSRGYLYIYAKVYLFRFIHRLAFRFACFPFIVRGFKLFNEISSFSLQIFNSCNEVNYSYSHICKNNEVNACAENLEFREYGHEYAERGSGQYTDNRKQHDINQNSCRNTILVFLRKRFWEYSAICDTAVPPERAEWLSFSDKFHKIIADTADNPFLQDCLRKIYRHITIFSVQYETDSSNRDLIQAAHEHIVELLEEGNYDEAILEYKNHVLLSADLAKSCLTE